MVNELSTKVSSNPRYVVDLRDLVNAAQHHITVVNWPAAEGETDGTMEQARKAYLDELVEASARIGYERILQIPLESEAGSDDLYDATYNEHFEKMRAAPNAQLLVRRALVPITFAIVDDRHLAVELNAMGSTEAGGTSWTSNGGFILRNAPPHVLACFQDLVTQLRESAPTVSTSPTS